MPEFFSKKFFCFFCSPNEISKMQQISSKLSLSPPLMIFVFFFHCVPMTCCRTRVLPPLYGGFTPPLFSPMPFSGRSPLANARFLGRQRLNVACAQSISVLFGSPSLLFIMTRSHEPNAQIYVNGLWESNILR